MKQKHEENKQLKSGHYSTLFCSELHMLLAIVCISKPENPVSKCLSQTVSNRIRRTIE